MRKPRILVLYFKQWKKRTRITVDEHLYSFRRYVNKAKFYYFNTVNGIPKVLTIPRFDGVIIHYTFFTRWHARGSKVYKLWFQTIKNLKNVKGYKIGIPQDEFLKTDVFCQIFKEYNIRTVFSNHSREEIPKVYPPDKVRLDRVETVFTGYIDERRASKLRSKITALEKRPIDLGYRARKLPYWIGYHGQYKYKIGQIFLKKAGTSPLMMDISSESREVFLGRDWYKFLLRCKAVLGCEGGSSLLDSTGEVQQAVEEYMAEHPSAAFEEVEQVCFPGQDYNIKLYAISPRHFESIITKTCQVLLEGEYNGVLLPGIHYIELKKDFSNVEEIMGKVNDPGYCESIAQRAYDDIYKSGKFTYRVFASRVVDAIFEQEGRNTLSFRGKMIFLFLRGYLGVREFLEPLIIKLLPLVRYFRIYRLATFKKIWTEIKKKRK